LAEKRNDLLIGMTLAVKYDYTRIDPSTCLDAGGLCRSGRGEGDVRACHGDEF